MWKVWAHSSKLLQAAKRANKPKVLVPQAQDLMVLIGELVKVLNLYSKPVSKIKRKEKIQKKKKKNSSLRPSYTLPLLQKSPILTLPL